MTQIIIRLISLIFNQPTIEKIVGRFQNKNNEKENFYKKKLSGYDACDVGKSKRIRYQ